MNSYEYICVFFVMSIKNSCIVTYNFYSLQKIAGVISYDIEDLMRKSRKKCTKNKMYKLIESDIIKKVNTLVIHNNTYNYNKHNTYT